MVDSVHPATKKILHAACLGTTDNCTLLRSANPSSRTYVFPFTLQRTKFIIYLMELDTYPAQLAMYSLVAFFYLSPSDTICTD